MEDDIDLLLPFLRIIAASMGVKRISIVTPNDDGTLSPRVGLGLPNAAFNPVPWEMERVSAYVMETRNPVLVKEIGERQFKFNRSGYESSSFISAPIIINGEVWGVVNLTDKQDGSPFDEKDMNALSQHISAWLSSSRELASRIPSDLA